MIERVYSQPEWGRNHGLKIIGVNSVHEAKNILNRVGERNFERVISPNFRADVYRATSQSENPMYSTDYDRCIGLFLHEKNGINQLFHITQYLLLGGDNDLIINELKNFKKQTKSTEVLPLLFGGFEPGIKGLGYTVEYNLMMLYVRKLIKTGLDLKPVIIYPPHRNPKEVTDFFWLPHDNSILFVQRDRRENIDYFAGR